MEGKYNGWYYSVNSCCTFWSDENLGWNPPFPAETVNDSSVRDTVSECGHVGAPLSQGRGLFQRGVGGRDALEKGKAILSRGLLSTPQRWRAEEEGGGRVGRRREKMKTCEYLHYLQSKRLHYFPRWVRLSPDGSLPDGTAQVCRLTSFRQTQSVETIAALTGMCLFTRFIQHSAKERENSCVCPNYFITPRHEQTVYFWKLTPCPVNSSLTSGMGTDDLPSPSSSLCLCCPFLSSPCFQTG